MTVPPPPPPLGPWEPPHRRDEPGPEETYPWTGPPTPTPEGAYPWAAPPASTPEDTRPWGASPPPGPAPGAPGPKRSGPPFWLGVLTGFLTPLPLGLLSLGAGEAGSYLPLLALVAVVALVVYPRTRRFGLGTLAGVALLAIVGAGACVLFLGWFINEMGG